jgi:hypothetical protein
MYKYTMGITSKGWLKRQQSTPSKGRSVLVQMNEDEITALSAIAHQQSITPAELIRFWIRQTDTFIKCQINKKVVPV